MPTVRVRGQSAFSLLALLAALALHVPPAAAQLACGGTVGPGGTFTMSSDLNCGAGVALTVVGPAVLDMAGHKIRCSGGLGSALVLQGEKVTARNGTVQSCTLGVEIAGGGKHKVKNVFAESNLVGFAVGADRNSLTTNAAFFNGTGFLIQGARNKLTTNSSVGSASAFDVTGNANILLRNSTSDGRFLTASNTVGNKLKENIASGEITGAFKIDGAEHVIVRNAAIGENGGFVFALGAGGHTIQDNTAVGVAGRNATGFEIEVGGNSVTGNRASFLEYGISVGATSTGNTISGNRMLGNRTLDAVDLDPSCTGNAWTGNAFGKASPGCVN